MARSSGTSDRKGATKTRKAKPAGGRKIAAAKRRVSSQPAKSRSVKGLKAQLERQARELDEARQQQAATADVLKVIASSPTEIGPALQTIVESACKFCDAYDAGLLLRNGGNLHFSAHHGPIPTGREPRPLGRDWVTGRAVIDRMPVQVPDFQAPESADFPEGQRQSREQGHRCTLAVPLLREGEAIGAIVLRRLEPVAFRAKQVALLQIFADQAVIAIENARLFNETKEALERQTATAEILKVIARSPSNTTPVFEAIAASAKRLLGGFSCAVWRFVEGRVHLAAFTPITRAADAALRADFPQPVNNFEAFRLAQNGVPFPIPDTEAIAHAPLRDIARLNGFRSIIFVPLMNGSVPIGIIAPTRAEPGGFAPHHIQLLQTFADQAVIAIENTRLFTEVRDRTVELLEALEQQTATAEVLGVISSSAGDLAPVFDAMLRKAMQLCNADFGVLNTYDGKAFHTAATFGLPPAYDEYRRKQPLEYGSSTAPARLLLGEPFVEITDLLESEAYRAGEPNRRALVDIGGALSLLAVPLLKDECVVGNVMIFRQEQRSFSDKQITLLQQFAAQAVIAIENARLLQELRLRTEELSRSLDDLRSAQDRLVQTEKLASLGQLTAGIAHEIKNPLNFVNNFSALSVELTDELNELLNQATLAAELRKEVDELTRLLKDNLFKVVQHGQRADSIVKNMLLHSREGSGELRAADINGLVEESLNLAYHGARSEKPGFNVTLHREFDANAGSAALFPQEITRALLNLISNGFYAATRRKSENGDKAFDPVLSAATRNLGETVEIRIRDNGTGIPPEVREKMFTPFFTTKPTGEGTGLGLSMTHDIVVKQHGGRIDVETEPGAFTEFIITLPRGKGNAA